MRVFKSKAVNRWAHSEGVADAELCKAAAEVAAGKVEADLGGYLFKKRIARHGGGKSGGYRTIIGFRKGNTDRILFLYAFPKNARANITVKEAEALSIAASSFIDATDAQIAMLLEDGRIFELECPP
ncbi:MAG TPA: type II toxin-antitoxin system RelE/ParE family toxin [Alphaproteobacteria bacterium]|nr:type II toxin-antitoxin system RelE/ParE family toxin [Alphaproteobacteria bacterium]